MAAGRCGAALAAVVIAGILPVACGSGPSGSQTDGSTDRVGSDAVVSDAPADRLDGGPAALDGPLDTLVDRVPDAPVLDGPGDVTADVPADRPSDVAADLTGDIAVDRTGDGAIDAAAGADTSTDAGSDAAPDPFIGFRWVTLPAPLGTQITAVTLDSEGTLYAGGGGGSSFSLTPQAGLFKSTDEGASWRAVNHGIYDFHVAALASVGTTIYAGTAGLMRSIDRGATWLQATPASSVGLMRYIGAQGDLVMTTSDYGGDPFYTSIDSGQTFAAGKFASLDVASIEVLAGGTVILRAGGNGVLRSTDQGVTFSTVQGINDADQLDAQLRCDGANTCYANAHNTPNWTDPQVLMKSTDAGATWTPITPTRTQAGVLAVSDTGIVYLSAPYPSTQIARSDDGGATFTLINRPTMTGTYQPNCGGPFVARGDKLFAGCANGVYRSYDRGQHWQAASGSAATGAITGFAYNMFVDTSAASLGPAGDIYVVGAQDSGLISLMRSVDGGWTWQTIKAPFNSGSCIVTPGTALECLGVTLGSSLSFALARSEDHGATWRGITLPSGPQAGTTISFSTLVTSASGIYAAAGSSGVARSIDDGLTFQVIANSPAANAVQVLRSGHLLVAPPSPSTGTGYRSTDQGATWTTVDRLYSTLPLVEDATGRLIRGEGGGGLEVSTDEAVTWNNLPTSGVPYTLGVQLPLTIDGAGHLFLIGPGYPPGANPLGPIYGSPLQISASADNGAHFTPMPAQIPNPNRTAFATDKEGRLIVATTGGVFRLVSDADPGPPMPDGGVGGGNADGGMGLPPPRPLSLVVENAPWSNTGSTGTGFAVDGAGRVYRSDDGNVWVVDGGVVTRYLTLSEVTTGAGLAYSSYFRDLDVGPDGLLYALLSGGLMGASTSTDVVLTSSAAHQAGLVASLGGFTEGHMEVIAAGRVGYLTRNGFFAATASASAQSIYTAAALGWSDGCPIPEIAIDPAGAVAFMPGCNGRAIQRGTVAGGALGVLYQPNWDAAYGESVSCLAHDPSGGFFFLVTDDIGGGPRLVHVPDAVTSTAPLPQVPTEPSFGEVKVARGTTTFGACKMAVTPNGVIYVMTQKEVWKVGL